MKYLIINGSPRRGHTWELVSRAREKIENLDSNPTFTEIDLSDEDIDFCTGCFSCFTSGENNCPHSYKIQPIVEKMKEADGLIITSPVYALNTTALIKNFIDHLAYFYHRPYFFEKKALIVVTTAGAGHNKVGKYIDETLRNMGYNERFKLCFVDAHDSSGYLPLKTKQKVDNVSEKFYNSILNKKLKGPSMKALFYYNLWRAMAYNGHIPEDARYWNESKLIESEFYPKIKVNIVKRVLFRIFYNVMIRMMGNVK